MASRLRQRMRKLRRVIGTVLVAVAITTPASADIYLTGSLSASTSNVPYTTYQSAYGSGSIAFDLGRYIRLGFTHSQEVQVADGYKEVDEDDTSANATTSEPTADGKMVVKTTSQTHVIANSIDLTLVLYEGQVFVPYMMAGGVVKQYRFQQSEGETSRDPTRVTVGPVPNVGVGVGMRLNREFSLKLAYVASPGYAQGPTDPEPRGVWDKKVTIGLTYQL